MTVHRKVHVVAASEDQAHSLVLAHPWEKARVIWAGNFERLKVIGEVGSDHLYEVIVVFELERDDDS